VTGSKHLIKSTPAGHAPKWTERPIYKNVWKGKYVNDTKGSAYKTIFPQITRNYQTQNLDSIAIFRLLMG